MNAFAYGDRSGTKATTGLPNEEVINAASAASVLSIPKVCVGARLLWQHEGAEPALIADTPVLCIIQVPICVAPPYPQAAMLRSSRPLLSGCSPPPDRSELRVQGTYIWRAAR
jgi:hypothetical protein